MAVRAHLDLQVMAEGRTRLERVAAGAGDRDLFVLGVYRRFQGRARGFGVGLLLNGAASTIIKGRGSLAAAPRGLKRRAFSIPRMAVPYPQKLWTTLWMEHWAGRRFRSQIA